MIDALAPQQSRRVTSSSQRVEELVSPSGLSAQASIAGCLGSQDRSVECGVFLERLSHERSRVANLSLRIPSALKEIHSEELAGALLQSAWCVEAEQPHHWRGCAFLTRCGPNGGTGWHSSQVYVVRLELTDLSKGNADRPEHGAAQTGESVVPDTGRAYAVRQMAQAWKAIGRPLPEEEDAALSVDPDDYPLF
jgi:hypothetical protein